MYYFMSLLTGVLISVMIALNGELTGLHGVYSATVIAHISGLALVYALTLCNREHPFANRRAWFLYLGGVIGVLITVFNNIAYGRISVSAILALGLLGQSVTGIIFDQYGLLGMPKHPFEKRKIYGLALIFCGIASMTSNFDVLAVAMSFITGILIVVSRTINAKLAETTSMRISTFYNYLTGLAVAVPVWLILGRAEPGLGGFIILSKPYIYLGGIAGVGVVLLSNITVVKISAFYLSLFLFIGQVFSGILIDALISQAISARNLAGGVFVAAGLCVNLILDSRTS